MKVGQLYRACSEYGACFSVSPIYENTAKEYQAKEGDLLLCIEELHKIKSSKTSRDWWVFKVIAPDGKIYYGGSDDLDEIEEIFEEVKIE